MNHHWPFFVATFLSLSVVATGCTAPSEDEAEEDVESTSQEVAGGTCSPAVASGVVPAKHRALLDTIAYTEGTRGRGKDGYNVTFAYRCFATCAKHPNMRVCGGGYCSTAAGRYQFLKTTWDGLGLPTFTPDNQDKGGMKLVSRRGVNAPTGRAMTATEFTNAMNRLSWEWASLPPGRYGQPVYTMTATRREYCRLAGC